MMSPSALDRSLIQIDVPCLLTEDSTLWAGLSSQLSRHREGKPTLLHRVLSSLTHDLQFMDGLIPTDDYIKSKSAHLLPMGHEELAPFCERQLELIVSAKTRSERLIRFLAFDSLMIYLERVEPKMAAHLERRFEALGLVKILGQHPLEYVSYVESFDRPYRLPREVVKASTLRASMLELRFHYSHKGITRILGWDSLYPKREGVMGWLLTAGHLARQERKAMSTLSAHPTEPKTRRYHKALSHLQEHPSIPVPAEELLVACYQRLVEADTRRTLGQAFLELDGLIMYLEYADHPAFSLGYELKREALTRLFTRYDQEELETYNRRYMRVELDPIAS